MLLTVAGEPMVSRMRCTTAVPAARWPGGRAGRRRGGGAGEVDQVRALGVVELERVSERVQDAVGGAGGVATLQALVVLDAGQRRHLLAAEAGHLAAAPATQPSLLRG